MALPTGGFAIYNITNPTDPQVNGFGIYRTIDEGESTLLDNRIVIPDENEYSLAHYWEIFNVGTLTNVANLQLHFTIDLKDVPTTGQSDTTDNTARGTQQWEPGFEPPQKGSLALRDREFAFRNSEDTGGYRGTHKWEISGGFVTTETYTWVYLTDIADSALGAAAETNNDVPPACDITAEWQEQVWLSGNETNPHRVFFSRRFLPESFPAANFIDVGTANDPIRALAPYIGMIIAFTRDTKYGITGSSTAGYEGSEGVSKRGIAGKNCYVVTERGVIFVARDGVFSTSLVGADTELSQKIKPIFTGNETINGEVPINWTYADTISCEYFQDRFYMSYPTTGNTTPDRTAVYFFTTKEWYFYDFGSRTMFYEEDSIALTGGFTDGKAYTLESSTGDDGSDVAMVAETKEFDVGVRCLFLYMKIDADTKPSHTNDTTGISAEVYIDGILKHTATVSGDRTKVILPLPEDTWGHRWKVRFTYTGQRIVQIYGMSMYYLPLGSH